jgi:glycosyltransferase involved in cell wall biosynthesis
MRIAHFVQRYPPALGGSEAYFARLSRYLAAAGDDVTVFTTNADDLEAFWSRRAHSFPAGEETIDGVRVVRYPLIRLPAHRHVLKALSLFPAPRWQRLTLSCNPIAPGMWRGPNQSFDVVHATAFPYGWVLACAERFAKKVRVPFFLTPFLHLGDPRDGRDRTRRAYTSPALLSFVRAAVKVFVQTPSERDALIELGIAEEKLVLQGMGVEPKECNGGDRERARRAWDIFDDAVVIGHLANHSVEKGTVDLLKAVERMGGAGVRFHVVLAGPEMPNFARFWRGYRHAPQVRRIGVLTEDQKRDFFAGIDVFALPSRSDSFGLVLLEAWANGVPNVAYRAGGVGDVIRDGQDGLLARCGDVAELARALERLVTNAEVRRRMGEEGRRRIAGDFRWDDKLALVRAEYEKAAGRRG